MRLVFATVTIAALTGACCGQDNDVSVFGGMINGQNSILVVRDYYDASKLDGYMFVTRSKQIILLDGTAA